MRDLVLPAQIGVYPAEHSESQRIRVGVELGVRDPGGVGADRLERVLDYSKVVEDIRAIVGRGHVKLVETLAEQIAEACIADHRVTVARVRIEKLDILLNGATVGVEVVRRGVNLSTTINSAVRERVSTNASDTLS